MVRDESSDLVLNNGFSRPSGADLTAGYKPMNEETNPGPLQSGVNSDEKIDSWEVSTQFKHEQFEARAFDCENGNVISSLEDGSSGGYSDESSTDGVDPLRSDPLLRPSVSETSHPKVPAVGSTVHWKGFSQYISEPALRNMIADQQEKEIFRSWTDMRWIPRTGLGLDRRSEHDKQKLIIELVRIQKDGTVEVDLAKNAPAASELLELQSLEVPPISVDYIPSEVNKPIPKLKIAMLVVGTRGDVQPFVAVAKRLQEFGHHVRLATHTNFQTFVKSAGIEFYPLGGDPRALAGYMVRNKGLIPSSPGEISIQRKQLKAIIDSLLPACTEPDVETGEPFRAQAIIANPPAYGHLHVAEALDVPLHIFFTMPWTPTNEFSHPLARVPQSAGYWLSYIIVDLLIWWGIRGLINDFRRKKLKLSPIAYFSLYHGSLTHLPTAYMWSPHVVTKPNDWGSLVDVVGYCFLNLASNHESSNEFSEWIQKGSKPIYIGFGSMPLEDAKKTTDTILEALRKTGQRGILDRGWGDLGILLDVPDNVFLLADCPHDWLFPQCLAVVHHGGAGTTATGLRAGCPTTIVPFFGDQFFWGERIHQQGLGPVPIPISELTVEALSEAIDFMLQPEVKSRAMEVAKLIEKDDGAAAAVDAFHRHLPREILVPKSVPDENNYPNTFQWIFTQIGALCHQACGS
ncbi:sterol 3-beta-glucosyltransferase UGT80B1 [Impatiens glandulifera]|uniref:sterol 3-beta-glucosyltransferase UGT80B1 n=1 Tax=Impatiens glandulifera TaxID=253017 RepID=UPI001FB0F652|nr:sterol 3-beta-glucosyltransferase UGT80B1 [Impatiens glandulifera]XP_047341004.1 sterol 3-beta-glucosyltransferase UGT80B1 [Impatiens glandulifera]XP_047341005.1 sterol 3-beta-glucosyltransferase UGT80B1 [Impatiens glandulifera]